VIDGSIATAESFDRRGLLLAASGVISVGRLGVSWPVRTRPLWPCANCKDLKTREV